MTIKNSAVIGFIAETFIHSGCGSSQGAIDLPVAREAATDYPYIPGSALKGAFKDYAREIWQDVEKKDNQGKKVRELHSTVKMLFGQSDNAGELLVSDLRLLLLPVRSLTGNYKYVTCPQIINRLQRDLNRADIKEVCEANENYELIDENEPGDLFLEELSFKKINGTENQALTNIINDLLPTGELDDKLVIISNDSFHWFAKNALAIQARNVLNDKKASENLWYEESLPPDTVMYCLLNNRSQSNGAVEKMLGEIKEKSYLQTGGNETVGMGWFQIKEFAASNGGQDGD